MPCQSLICRIITLGPLCGGAILIAIAIALVIAQPSMGEVVIRADGLARLVLVKDVAELRQIEIVNGTGRPITLHNTQGWG